jgi:hypothetical protein
MALQQPAASRHLKMLRQEGSTGSRRDRRFFYSLCVQKEIMTALLKSLV